MTLSWDKKVLLGVFSIIAGIVLLNFELVDQPIGIAIINFGSIVAIISLAQSRRKEKVAHDERTRALGAKAASYSWMFTFVLLALLVWPLEYGLINIPAKALLGLLLAEMSLSMLVAKWWLGRKGI